MSLGPWQQPQMNIPGLSVSMGFMTGSNGSKKPHSSSSRPRTSASSLFSGLDIIVVQSTTRSTSFSATSPVSVFSYQIVRSFVTGFLLISPGRPLTYFTPQ